MAQSSYWSKNPAEADRGVCSHTVLGKREKLCRLQAIRALSLTLSGLKRTGNTLTQGEYLDYLTLQRMDVPSIAILGKDRH